MLRRPTWCRCSARSPTRTTRPRRASTGPSPSSCATPWSAAGPERFRRLRALGDHSLYALGFFGGHIELKGVDRGYVSSVGSTAYSHAAAMLRTRARAQRSSREPDVLSELAAKFDRFAAVLADVAEGTLACGARDERSVVKLYERWLKTGSSRLAEELGARGIVPTRGMGGSN